MANQEVTVYTSTGCPHCKAAKEFLESKGVDFTEKNVADDEAAAEELSDQGIKSVPVLFIGDTTIVGFDKDRIEQALSD